MRHFETDRGAALLTALIVMAIVAAMGLGLALTTSLEPLAAANYEANRSARLAAEAGVAIAVHELAGIADWNLVARRPDALRRAGAGQHRRRPARRVPRGARGADRARHVRPPGRLLGERAQRRSPPRRPWGPNNPRWRVFGHGRLDRLVPQGAGLPPVSWWSVGRDDPADVDGDPLADSGIGPGGEWRPGGCVLAVRAEAFGPRFAHRTVVATVARPAPGCGPGARLVSLRGLN